MFFAPIVLLTFLPGLEAGARILADKILNTKRIIAEEVFSIDYTLANVGHAPALNVHLVDKHPFTSDKFRVKGVLDATFPVIKPNERVTHSIIVYPLKSGTFNDAAIPLEYIDSATGKLQQFSFSGRHEPRIIHTPINKRRDGYIIGFSLIVSLPTVLAFLFFGGSKDYYERFNRKPE